uniref:Integrase core domain containing protein n=1 Tax=Solanum tuberosum TaxID=4113 RepID=M1DK38_SOLTU
MARDPGTYGKEMVWEFYASYAATLRSSISKRSKPIAQDPLTSTMVRGCLVDISHTIINRFLYGPTMGHSWSLNAIEFCGAALSRGMLIRERQVSPTKADNQLTWDRAVMVATLVAGVEIDFSRMLLAEIHERELKTCTTYPFPCLIFRLCRDSGVLIWHCDRLIHPTGTLDIGLIRDEANVAAPRREPQIELPPLGVVLADTVELASLRTDIDAILAAPTVEPQVAPTALTDDTVLDASFSGTAEEGLEPTHAKGASSSASVVEVPPVVRDIVSITDGAMMDDVDTTEGDPTIVPMGSGKPGLPTRS